MTNIYLRNKASCSQSQCFMFCFHQGQTIKGLEPWLSRKEEDSGFTVLEERSWTNIKKTGDETGITKGHI